MEDLKRAIQQGDLTLVAEPFALQIPLLQGRLPAQEGPLASRSRCETYARGGREQ